MGVSLEGVIANLHNSTEDKFVRFQVQMNDGTYITCDYIYQNNLPLKVGDFVQCVGDFVHKTFGDRDYNIFECESLTARYQFDLLNFLISYMPYMKVDKKNDIEAVNTFYREATERIMDYCKLIYDDMSADSLCLLFNGLYICMENKNDEELLKFSKKCFNSTNLNKIKAFLKYWNNDVLVRPLQLLGLSDSEISAIHIPLNQAYQILKTNPYRLPQVEMSTATKIVNSHLRLEPGPIDYQVNHEQLEYKSSIAVMCGEISRMIYQNIITKKWTSTPIDRILEKYESFNEFKDKIYEFYFCKEDYDHVYYYPMYQMEKKIADKMVFLIKKRDRVICNVAYPDIILDEHQDAAVKGGLMHACCMIHGGPGTGKTSISSEIIRNVNKMGRKILCLAPTGAASVRLRDTAKKAKVFDLCDIMTIHMAITVSSKIIDMKPDYILIDEISMVHSGLIYKFISTFRSLDYQLILTGDFDQLEPIEIGNFMEQMLKTPIKKYRLEKNYRSQKTIMTVCQEVVDKQRIKMRTDVNWYKSDVDYRFHIGNLMYLEQLIVHYATSFPWNNSISKEENFANFALYRDKFAIITPYRKNVEIINPIFQKYFMSYVKEHTDICGTRYYVGDRVMKLINDYGMNIMNGEIGKVIKAENGYIVCMFRNNPDTMTPYIDRNVFCMMKDFVKKNNIKFEPVRILQDGTDQDKSKEEIKTEVEMLRRQFSEHFYDSSSNNSNTDNKGENQIQKSIQDMTENRTVMVNLEMDINNSNSYIEDTSMTYEERKKAQYSRVVRMYFSLLEQYPKAMFNIAEDSEFINIDSITLAYAITTHKSQGSQFPFVIAFLDGKINPFITINNVYTMLSRAQDHLDIVTESIELINGVCLNKRRYVYDKLYQRINEKLPKEILLLEQVEEIVEEFESSNIDDFDEIDEDDYEYYD